MVTLRLLLKKHPQQWPADRTMRRRPKLQVKPNIGGREGAPANNPDLKPVSTSAATLNAAQPKDSNVPQIQNAETASEKACSDRVTETGSGVQNITANLDQNEAEGSQASAACVKPAAGPGRRSRFKPQVHIPGRGATTRSPVAANTNVAASKKTTPVSEKITANSTESEANCPMSKSINNVSGKIVPETKNKVEKITIAAPKTDSDIISTNINHWGNL